jgi:hypothetical protein
MRFRAKFLQPITTNGPQQGVTITHIPNVFITPDGRIEGEDPDITNALEHRNAGNREVGTGHTALSTGSPRCCRDALRHQSRLYSSKTS